MIGRSRIVPDYRHQRSSLTSQLARTPSANSDKIAQTLRSLGLPSNTPTDRATVRRLMTDSEQQLDLLRTDKRKLDGTTSSNKGQYQDALERAQADKDAVLATLRELRKLNGEAVAQKEMVLADIGGIKKSLEKLEVLCNLENMEWGGTATRFGVEMGEWGRAEKLLSRQKALLEEGVELEQVDVYVVR